MCETVYCCTPFPKKLFIALQKAHVTERRTTLQWLVVKTNNNGFEWRWLLSTCAIGEQNKNASVRNKNCQRYYPERRSSTLFNLIISVNRNEFLCDEVFSLHSIERLNDECGVSYGKKMPSKCLQIVDKHNAMWGLIKKETRSDTLLTLPNITARSGVK